MEEETKLMNYFLQGFGVFLGVIAGVVVTLIAQTILDKRRNKKNAQNLLFEFELDIKKIDLWLEEIERYRNAVNSETMSQYFGYFDLSKFVAVTANNMFTSGLLYDYLSHYHISTLQEITSYFSLNGEKYINDQIEFNRNSFDKARTIGDVNYHEGKFKSSKKLLHEIMDALKTKL